MQKILFTQRTLGAVPVFFAKMSLLTYQKIEAKKHGLASFIAFLENFMKALNTLISFLIFLFSLFYAL